MNKVEVITSRLNANFSPSYLEVLDESADHIGHAGYQGGGRHFAIIIASTHFNGLSRVDIHRQIYAALADLLPEQIHALRIVIKSTK